MSIKELIKTIATLRSENGCPWDREQTHETLFPYLIEEVYEAIDAYQKGPLSFAEELGDILLQIVLHSQIAKEKGDFDFEKVAHLVNQKMIRRHPHVFGDTKADKTEEVLQNWEDIKIQEKGGKNKNKSVIGGIPTQFPALLKAFRLGEKASSVGFDWKKPKDVMLKVKEEINELEEAMQNDDMQHREEEFGDLLFSLANLARHLNINAELACNRTNNKFIERFQKVESMMAEEDKQFKDLNQDELEVFWERAKKSK